MWQRVILTLTLADNLRIEVMSEILREHGALGVEIEYAGDYLKNEANLFGDLPVELPPHLQDHPSQVIGYFDSTWQKGNLEAALASAVEVGQVQIIYEAVPDQDWHHQWKQYYQPQVLSRYLTVVPEWVDYHPRPQEQVILMDPGLAFGTGNHDTTRLSAQALEMVMRSGERVLDVGTGTGILSFVAGILGAKTVWGLDLDPQAITAARENLTLQTHPQLRALIDRQQIHFQIHDLLQEWEQEADIIVANILPHILVKLFNDSERLLREGGYFILGGILVEKAQEIETAMAAYTFTLVQKTQTAKWVTFIYQKMETLCNDTLVENR